VSHTDLSCATLHRPALPLYTVVTLRVRAAWSAGPVAPGSQTALYWTVLDCAALALLHCIPLYCHLTVLYCYCTALFHSNYESQGCTFGRPLWPDSSEAANLSDEEDGLSQAAAAGLAMGSVKVLGQQPGSELPVLLKRGPFGLYVQLVGVQCCL
jgi:hypothetical protein